MTRRNNARVAGFMFLFYIATGITSLILFRQATGGAEGTAATLASIAQHPTTVRLTAVLTLLAFFDAVVLAVALYGLTRDQDPDLAMIALCCRIGEGVLSAAAAVRTLGLISVATASTVASPDGAAAQALGALLLKQDGWSGTVGAACFAVGSTLYCWLFLRARSIPTWLAWLGVLGSALLVAALPLQMAGFLRGPVTYYVWIPIAVFEVIMGFLLLFKGLRPAGAAGAAPAVG
jgi:hypothetical protein